MDQEPPALATSEESSADSVILSQSVSDEVLPPAVVPLTGVPTPDALPPSLEIQRAAAPSRRIRWKVVVPLLILFIGVLCFLGYHYGSKNVATLGVLPATGSDTSAWGTITTSFGAMRYPLDSVHTAKTTTNTSGALVLYANGRTLSLLTSNTPVLSGAPSPPANPSTYNSFKYNEQTLEVDGVDWHISETIVDMKLSTVKGKEYQGFAETSKNGKTYTLNLSQGESQVLSGGDTITNDVLAQIRQDFLALIQGVKLN